MFICKNVPSLIKTGNSEVIGQNKQIFKPQVERMISQGIAMKSFDKALSVIATAGILTMSPAMAGTSTPLSPGKPAGITQAQHHGPSLVLIGGAALATVIAVVVATQSGGSSSCSATNCPTTSSTASTS